MGVINVTPDSFSDGGRFFDTQKAVEHGLKLAEDGADALDVGGESTRPGAAPPALAEELRRVIPVVEALVARTALPVSVDTSRPEVMRAARAVGAGFINDVRALGRPGAVEAAVECDVPVCLMHMRGEPGDMQRDPRYRDVVSEVREYLLERVAAAVAAGIDRGRIFIDPGFGFGKSLAHNLALLKCLGSLADTGLPVLVGLSRKSMIVGILGYAPEDRLAAGLGLALRALDNGASMLRVHDVRATREALAAWRAAA